MRNAVQQHNVTALGVCASGVMSREILWRGAAMHLVICDGRAGASGKLDPMISQEYGSQDFFGVIDELRIWRTVRTEEQIQQVALSLPGKGRLSSA